MSAIAGQRAADFRNGNVAQATVNTLYGISGVFGGIALHDVNPAVFGAYRCWACALILLPYALYLRGHLLPRSSIGLHNLLKSDGWWLLLLSIFLFQGEFFFMAGLKLAGPIAASLWQPSQPILTTFLAAVIGLERLTAIRMAGVSLAFVGCVIMVLGSAGGGGEGAAQGSPLMGHFALFLNCLGTPLYLLACKPLLRRGYSGPVLTCIAFLLNSLHFAAAVTLVQLLPSLHETLCARAHADAGGDCLPAFAMSGVAWGGLVYIAVLGTAVPFLLQMFATRVLNASLVSAYYALQPVTSALCTYILIAITPSPHLGLRGARASDLGGLLVLVGLAAIVRQDWRNEQQAAARAIDSAESAENMSGARQALELKASNVAARQAAEVELEASNVAARQAAEVDLAERAASIDWD